MEGTRDWSTENRASSRARRGYSSSIVAVRAMRLRLLSNCLALKHERPRFGLPSVAAVRASASGVAGCRQNRDGPPNQWRPAEARRWPIYQCKGRGLSVEQRAVGERMRHRTNCCRAVRLLADRLSLLGARLQLKIHLTPPLAMAWPVSIAICQADRR